MEDWRLVTERGQKINKYTLYVVQTSNEPVYYEMHGYDTLFGSHYDDYKITYDSFTKTFDDSVFDAPIQGMLLWRFNAIRKSNTIVNTCKQLAIAKR